MKEKSRPCKFAVAPMMEQGRHSEKRACESAGYEEQKNRVALKSHCHCSSNLRTCRHERTLIHTLPLSLGDTPLLVDVIGKIDRADEPGRLLGSGAISGDGQLLEAGSSLRFGNRKAEVFFADAVQRDLRLSKFRQQTKVRWVHAHRPRYVADMCSRLWPSSSAIVSRAPSSRAR